MTTDTKAAERFYRDVVAGRQDSGSPNHAYTVAVEGPSMVAG